MIIAGILIVWIICAILHYGLWLAYFQRRWPALAEEDFSVDAHTGGRGSLLGPLALFIFILTPSSYPLNGFMYRNPHRKGK